MRGLRELQLADTPAAVATRGSWGDRQRVGFLFALGSVACLLVAGYLWARLPEIPAPPTTDQYSQFVEHVSQSDLFALNKEVAQGLRPFPHPYEADIKARQAMTWGIGIVLVLALLSAASACVVVWNSPRRKT
jgi:hypothetical protein